MPGLFNEIQIGRFARALQKHFGQKGAPPTMSVGPDLVPTFPLIPGAELDYLLSWNRFGFSATLAAVAAQFGFGQLRNPAGSNVVGEIVKIAGAVNVATTGISLVMGVSALAQGTAASVVRMDARLGALQPSIAATTGTAVSPLAGLNAIELFRRSTADTFEIIMVPPCTIPLLPGDAVILAGGGANNVFDVTFWWRERVLEESEKSLSPAGG